VAVRFLLPSYLRPFAGGTSRLEFGERPATVGEALALLGARHPGVRDRVLTEQGAVRPHVNVFVGEESIRYTGGLATPLGDGAEVSIVPAVSGGAPLRGLVPALAAIVALCAAATSAFAAGNADLPHPRLGLYGHTIGNGSPLINPDNSVNITLLVAIARYDAVVLPISPFTEYRPDVLASLRQLNPSIKIYGYTQADYCWWAAQPDSFVNLPTRHWRLVRDLGGFLYKKQGGSMSDANINLAKKVGGRYVVAEALADYFQNVVLASGVWDGLFFDRNCQGILWQETPTETIDYVRAGYSSLAAFDVAWSAAKDTLANRLRRIAGPTPVLIGNCGQGTQYASFNGWMRENFPIQNGGTWDANMFRVPGGYMVDEANFRAPQANWIASWVTDATHPYAPEQVRKARYGLGTAALGDGFGTFNPPDLDITTNYMSWWYDEYAVNLATGRSTAQRSGVGWLGRALGPYAAMPTASTEDATAPNPGFELDLAGWTFWTSAGASVTRDATTAAVGTASARFTVPVPTNGIGAVRLTTVGTMTFFSNSSYRVTFWAKASTPRTIQVAAVQPFFGATYASADVAIDASWRRYEVTLTSAEDPVTQLQFRVGGTSGTVWIDDAHFTRTGINIYRRDFERGIVLVNPNADGMPVLLEQTYRRIQGTVDPANDGSAFTQTTVPARDALFLIRGSSLVDADTPELAPSFAFASVAPNPAPFGTSSAVRLTGAKAGPLRVSIHDAAGRRVRALFDGVSEAGARTFTWDGKDERGQALPRGLYFLRADQAGAVATKKLVRT
jgi:molybdopterin converting factor small subunit